MNQKQLSYFLEVYRCRNIQAAADKLYLTHQGLSRVIRSLEEEFGSPLFTRTNRGLEPTDFATTLVPHVQRLLDDYATIQGVHTLTSQARSVVTIYALDHLFGYLGADLLLDFHRQHPEITLSILDTTDEYALESLSAGRCDFAVVNGPIETPDESLLQQLVEAGLGIATTYDFTAVSHCGENTVVRYLDDDRAGHHIYLVEKAGTLPTRAGRAFKRFLLDKVTE